MVLLASLAVSREDSSQGLEMTVHVGGCFLVLYLDWKGLGWRFGKSRRLEDLVLGGPFERLFISRAGNVPLLALQATGSGLVTLELYYC